MAIQLVIFYDPNGQVLETIYADQTQQISQYCVANRLICQVTLLV
jgi:hypothetical protein